MLKAISAVVTDRDFWIVAGLTFAIAAALAAYGITAQSVGIAARQKLGV